MQLSYEDVLRALHVESLPGTPEQHAELVQWSQELVDRNGPDFLEKNRHRLVWEWEWVVENS